jgi:hypothetical protein
MVSLFGDNSYKISNILPPPLTLVLIRLNLNPYHWGFVLSSKYTALVLTKGLSPFFS